jgi:hypothetical protein
LNGGVCPIKAFPMLGDCGSRLHKRERSISWDAVVVCRVDRPGCWSHAGDVALEPGRREARTWARKIHDAGLDFTESDETNIAYAQSIILLAAKAANSNSHRGTRPASRRRTNRA